MIEQLGPSAFLQRFEESWSPRLRGRTLVGEALMDCPPTDQPLMALRAFGRLYRKSHQPYLELERRPASLLVAMTWIAAEQYDAGGFWPRVWEQVGRPPGPEEQSRWGGAFLEALRSRGLPVFDVNQTYVGNVLMHAGLPTSELDDFFCLLQRARRCVGDDSTSVTGWVRDQAARGTADITKAAARFLVDGEEVADDLIDRSLDLLQQLESGQEPSVALGERFARAAREHMTFDRRRAVPHPRVGVSPTAERPGSAELRLDTTTGQVLLALPFVADAPADFTWRLVADGRADVIRPRQSRTGRQVGAVAARWDIPKPVTSVTVGAGALSPFKVTVVDPERPVLFFHPEGHQVGVARALPRDDVWVLRPSSQPLTQGAARRIAELDAPAGWSGWTLELLDLGDATELTWGSHRETVRGLRQARVVMPEPLTGISSRGLPVLSGRPTVELPPGSQAENWSITVVDADTNRLYSTARGPHDLFPGISGPVVGSFDITVRGPLGRGRQVRLAIAETLSVSYSPACRVIRPDGLSMATATFTATQKGGLSLPGPATFAPADQALTATVSAGARSLDLDVKPPAMAVCLVRGGVAGPYLYGPVDVLTEELGDAELLLRLPDEAPRRLALVVGRGTPSRQRLEATRHQSGPLRFPLSRAADTAQRLGAGDMVFEGVGDPVLLLRFRPRRMAEGVVPGARGVRVVAPSPGQLEVVLWAVFAPWIGSRVAPVGGDGEVEVPDDLTGQGPLAVLVRVVDDWNPEPAPASPLGLDVLHVDLRTEATASALTRWLAQAVPSLRERDTNQLVAVLAMSSALGEEGGRLFPSWVIEHVVDVLAETGEGVVDAVRRVVPDADNQVRLLVDSGLGARDLRGDVDGLSGVLSSSPLLGALGVDRRSLTRPACREEVAESLGDDFLAVAGGGDDPAASVGRFDSSVERLAASDQWDAVRRQMKLVPRRFLDADARASAALELCERRRDVRLTATVKSAQRLLMEARWALKQAGLRDAAESIDARRERERTDGWLSLSALSLAMALLARFSSAGYGSEVSDALRAARPHWRAVTSVAPGLVARDLALAQAFVLRHDHADDFAAAGDASRGAR